MLNSIPLFLLQNPGLHDEGKYLACSAVLCWCVCFPPAGLCLLTRLMCPFLVGGPVLFVPLGLWLLIWTFLVDFPDVQLHK